MGVVIEICIQYPGGPIRMRGTDIGRGPIISGRQGRYVIYQLPRFILDPPVHLTALEEAEIIPGKHSDTRIKPLALTNRGRTGPGGGSQVWVVRGKKTSS